MIAGRAWHGRAYPLWMLKYLPNMPACHIGIRYDARGPNNTIAEGDVSSLLALGEAADVIRRGHADVMIVGGTGSRCNISSMVWHRGARLALNGKPDPAQICRPFDAERSGMVYGEGAAQLILESREFAGRRGVRPLARVVAVASRSEPTHSLSRRVVQFGGRFAPRWILPALIAMPSATLMLTGKAHAKMIRSKRRRFVAN